MKDFHHFLFQMVLVKEQQIPLFFTKHVENDILLVQIYVDDIIFGSTNEKLYKDFESCVNEEFEMSMMGELNYFLGLQIK